MLGETISHSLKSLGDHDEFKKVGCSKCKEMEKAYQIAEDHMKDGKL
jgi:hypothetical protein